MKQWQTVAAIAIFMLAVALFALGYAITRKTPRLAHKTATLDCTYPYEAKAWPGSHHLYGFDFDAGTVLVRVVDNQGAPYVTTPLQVTVNQGQTYALQLPLDRNRTFAVKITDTEIGWTEFTHDGRIAWTLDRQTSLLHQVERRNGKWSGDGMVECKPYGP